MLRLVSLVLALALSGCATTAVTQDRYLALSPESRALYDKYHQFMTDERAEAYFAAPSDDARREMVAELHVEDRLARYPKFVQDAVWSRTPVVGMDKTALFLTLGRPDAVDRLDAEPEDHLLPREVWRYRRGPNLNQDYVLTLVNDQIVDVKRPEIR